MTIVSFRWSASARATSVAGCSPRQANRHPLGHVGSRRVRDPALRLGVTDSFVPQRQLVRDCVGDGAAMRAFQQALLLEVHKVPADGGRRSGQIVGEIGDRD